MGLFADLQRLSDVRAAERDAAMQLRRREVEALERIAAAAERSAPLPVSNPTQWKPLNTSFRGGGG